MSPSPIDAPTPPRGRVAVAYVALGLAAGGAYALLNTYTDVWARASSLGEVFAAFHAFVDRGLPLLVGALAGFAFYGMHLRGRLAVAERARADELKSRLRHVERDQAVWVVVAAALHELKNPLHTLGLLLDELEHAVETRDEPRARDLAGRARGQMSRTLVPLDALRSLARPSRRDRTRRPLGDVVDEVASAMRPLAHESGVALTVEGARAASTPADAEYVRIILDNLLSNALEPQGQARARRVRVTLERKGDAAVVRVSDDGAGVPAERRARLFEPLQTEKSRGLGLGLPIARALARALGGELVLVDARPERDAHEPFATTFELVLPTRA